MGLADVPESERQRPAVPGLVALRRTLAGIGAGVTLVSIVALLWRDVTDQALVILLVAALQFLHEPDDRHSRAAAVAAGVVSSAVAIGFVIFSHAEPDLPLDVACAALAALAGSQAYAFVTRRPPSDAGDPLPDVPDPDAKLVPAHKDQ